MLKIRYLLPGLGVYFLGVLLLTVIGFWDMDLLKVVLMSSPFVAAFGVLVWLVFVPTYNSIMRRYAVSEMEEAMLHASIEEYDRAKHKLEQWGKYIRWEKPLIENFQKQIGENLELPEKLVTDVFHCLLENKRAANRRIRIIALCFITPWVMVHIYCWIF